MARRYEFYARVAREHKVHNIKLISSRKSEMIVLLYKHTADGVFDNFPKISDHFPKFPRIFQSYAEG